jgi:hypothetical protein
MRGSAQEPLSLRRHFDVVDDERGLHGRTLDAFEMNPHGLAL